ncbi:MAG: glycosyltransferase, partial [Oscillibacter sp.]|nr:glycosyltransferase [Oscillibacter sp.]
VRPRTAGGSKWSVAALFCYALRNLAAFTAAPLHLVTALGVVTFAFSVILGVQSLWKKLTGQALEGFTTVILLQLLIGSALMLSLGIIGYYLAKIYEEIKDRPRYIVAEETERETGKQGGTAP